MTVVASLEYAARHNRELGKMIDQNHVAVGESNEKQVLLTLFWFYVAATILGIWGLSTWTQGSPINVSAIPKPAEQQQVSIPAQSSVSATPKVLPPPAPAEAKKQIEPWVNDYEILREKRAGRILLVYSPDELIDMRVRYGLEGVQPYVDKWIKASNEFLSLKTEKIDKRDYLVVRVRSNSFNGYVFLYFDQKRWEEKLLSFRPNDKVIAICQFAGFQDFSLLGYNCELP